MTIKNIIYSWDLILALFIASITSFILYPNIKNDFAKDLFSVGISVLAIVFSVYFAALAIIISSGDNDFIEYLEGKGYYSVIISVFRFSLVLLFVALIYSIIAYGITSYLISEQEQQQGIFLFFTFSFLSLYSLFATVSSSLDAINYSKYRVKFLLFKKRQAQDKDEKLDRAEVKRLN